ncbi:MAG: hypothetical protein V1646_03930 [bacterium]
MNKRILSSLICTFLILQIAITSVCAMSTGIELTTAALRAPILIMTKKAEHDKKFKKSYLLAATANFIRLTNDLAALYNLYQKNNDENLYKLTKVMWIGQDFVSLLGKVKLMTSTDSDKWKKIETDGEKKINLMLSDFLKRLEIYILPSLEGAASVMLCWDSTQNDSSTNSLSLLLQTVVSGSRLLEDMLEAESGSLDQKIIVATAVVHAVLLLADLVKAGPDTAKSNIGSKSASISGVAGNVENREKGDCALESQSGVAGESIAHVEPVEVVEPVRGFGPDVDDQFVLGNSSVEEVEQVRDAAELELIDVPGGELGLIRTKDGMRSARVALMGRQDYTQFFGRGVAQRKILKRLEDAMRHDS